jgi:putative transposase
LSIKLELATMKKTYKYFLKPTKEQEQVLNWILKECWKLNKTLLKEKIIAYKKKQRQPSQFDQVKEVKKIKEQSPKLKQIFSQILQNIPKQRIPAIWQNFQQRKKTNPKAGLPQPRPLHRYRSFTYPQHGFKIKKGQLVLSQGQGYPELIIDIILHTQLKNGRKEGRPLPKEIETCSIFLKNGKWYVCFICEVEVKSLPKTGKEVGVDMGLDIFCATSDNEKQEIKQFHRKQQEQLTKLSKKLSQRKHKRSEEDKTKPSQRYLSKSNHNYLNYMKRLLVSEQITLIS